MQDGDDSGACWLLGVMADARGLSWVTAAGSHISRNEMLAEIN